MPLHLQAITNEEISGFTADLLLMAGKDPDALFVSENKYILSRFVIMDELSGEPFGKITITMKINDESIEIIDIDITLDNNHRTKTQFLDLLSGSSDANEYYHAMTEDDEVHFELETVCRHVISDTLVGSCRDVSFSVFPFALTVYDSIEEFNQWAGFKKEIKVGETDLAVHGFSEYFMMPGGTFGGKKAEDESFTFLLGTVQSWRDIRWRLGNNTLDFVIAWLDTALGEIPVAMGKEVFDLTNLKKGAIIGMNADIKADLSKPEDFSIVNRKTS